MKIAIDTKNWFKRAEKPLEEIINEAKPDGGANKKLKAEINIRVRNSLKDWASSVNEAEDPFQDDGIRLQSLFDIYRNIELDPHVTALVETIFNGVSQTPFEIENGGTSDIFEKSWFLDFIRYVLKSENWGVGAINFIVTPGAGSVVVVEDINRWYLRPDQKGYSYEMDKEKADEYFDKDPLKKHSIFIDGDGLGRFNHIAKRFIMKREVIQFWAIFNELFTTPHFIVNTDINNDKHRENLIEWLEERKHSSYSIVGQGDKLEAISGNTRGFDSYEKFEKSSNDAMSKAFLGSTMVLDDGSSRSQAEVHERNTNAYIQAKRIYLEFLINEQVIPILSFYGLIPANAVFNWNLSHQYGPKEWAEIIRILAGLFNLDEDEISEKIGLTLTEKELLPIVTPETVEALDTREITNRISEKLKKLYNV